MYEEHANDKFSFPCIGPLGLFSLHDGPLMSQTERVGHFARSARFRNREYERLITKPHVPKGGCIREARGEAYCKKQLPNGGLVERCS